MDFTQENYEIAEQIIKDILYMYVDLIHSGEITEDIFYGSFDELDFINSKCIDLEGYDIDIDLINEGSAIKMLCKLCEEIDAYSENSIHKVFEEEYLNKIIKCIDLGLPDHLEDIKIIIEEFFTMDKSDFHYKFQVKLKPIYSKYVVGYFKKMISDYL